MTVPRVHLYLKGVGKPGVYPLNFNTGISPDALAPYNYGHYYDGSNRYVTDSQHTGTVTITRADTVNKIIAGTFEFTGYDPKTKQTISISEGRFDVKTR